MYVAAQIIDGDSDAPGHRSQGSTLTEQVAYAGLFSRGAHEDTLKRIAKEAAVELTRWLEWINGLAARKGVRLEVTLLDTPERDYWARVSALPGQDKYQIEISLGSIPTILYIAPIVDLGLSGSSFHYPAIEMGVKELKEAGFPYSSFFLQTAEGLVVDAVVMILLHEVAHALGAHLRWPDLYRADDWVSYRAAETDADWGAGRMFVIGLLEDGHPVEDIARRLTGSAIINFIALELRRKETKKYHLPQQRLMAIMQGADSARKPFDLPAEPFRNAMDQFNANLVWVYSMFAKHFQRGPASETWFGDEDVESDRQVFEATTVPRVIELRSQMFNQRIPPM